MHNRLMELRKEHRELDTLIGEIEMERPVDQLKIQRLKRRKLQLKDEIAKIEGSFLPDIIA